MESRHSIFEEEPLSGQSKNVITFFCRVVYCSLKMMRCLKKLKSIDIHTQNDKIRLESLNRSLSLVLQTMALNVLSLFVVVLRNFFNVEQFLQCHLLQMRVLQICFNFVQFVVQSGNFFTYTIGLNYCNSNLGFFVHCYYSKIYRAAAVSMFKSAKNRLVHFCCRCCTKIQSDKILQQPTAKTGGRSGGNSECHSGGHNGGHSGGHNGGPSGGHNGGPSGGVKSSVSSSHS